jgi:hypothetical protein
MNNQQPGEFDAVLGGNSPLMEGGAVLDFVKRQVTSCLFANFY